MLVRLMGNSKTRSHSLFSMPGVVAENNPMQLMQIFQLAGIEVQVLELRTLWGVSYCVRYFLKWESNLEALRDLAAILAVLLDNFA